jgi:hypothetical protein
MVDFWGRPINASTSSNYVQKNGDIMSGTLNMNANNIINLAKPNNTNDAVNKTYVDTKNNVGLIPNLTEATNNRSGFVVTSSGDFNTNYAAWKIWNMTTSPTLIYNEWSNANLLANYWVMIQFISPVTVWKFQICGRYNDTCQPSEWKIEGSNDATTFVVLHTSTVTLTTTVMEFQFNPTPTVAYKYYRFYATASSSTVGSPGLSTFQLF